MQQVDPYWQTCPICKCSIGVYGRYNHMMYHVRRNEATKETDPRSRFYFDIHLPYIFFIVKKSN